MTAATRGPCIHCGREDQTALTKGFIDTNSSLSTALRTLLDVCWRMDAEDDMRKPSEDEYQAALAGAAKALGEGG